MHPLQALLRVVEELNVLFAFVAGTGTSLLAQWIARRWNLSDKRNDEQRALAAELLLDVEKHRQMAVRSRKKDSGVSDDELSAHRFSIDARAVALTDPVARKHMEDISMALWWLSTSEPKHKDSYPVVIAARAILGAIQRGETVPNELPTIREMVDYASAVSQAWEDQITAQEECG